MKKRLTILTCLMLVCSFMFGQNQSSIWGPITKSPDGLNMSANLGVLIQGESQNNADLEIGAFCGQELRGLSHIIDFFGNGQFYVAATQIYGTNGDVITFKLYNPDNNIEYICDNTITFEANATVASPFEPYELNFYVPVIGVAEVNGVGYQTLAEAYNNAAEGSTINLLCDAQGAGIVIDKNVTINFNSHAYTFVSPAVGSNGTKTLGFQILKDNDVTLTNGTLNVAAEAGESFAMLIQNYADLTLTDMTLDGDNLNRNNYSYVLSNNSGEVLINGATSIIANVVEGEDHFALDSYDYSQYYALPVVTVNTTGQIMGAVEVSATLNLKAVGEGSNMNVIIAGNGQLYNDVPVTVSLTKEIDPYDQENESGWYTISAPFATKSINIVGDYTLFRYDEGKALWENHKKHNFGIEVGRGYLYANLEGNDLTLVGVANVYEDDYATSLTFESTAEELKGNHLLGNPYTFDITGNHLAGDIAGGFYQMAGDGAWVPSELTEEIAVGEGFLVQANSATNLAINKTATETRSADNGSLQINVANDVYSDVAYVSFNEGVGLSKISHQNANIPMVYVPVENNDYAIAYLGENVEEVPFSFEAKTMGTYTISVKAQNCEFSTMTLVDRFTGVETNLLFEDYSFIAKSSDNSDRFILKLSRGTTDLEEEHFAYINNNGLIINNASGNATLQIFDVMGRPVSSHNVSGNANIAMESLTNGVYILRLIDDNNVRIQKVVID